MIITPETVLERIEPAHAQSLTRTEPDLRSHLVALRRFWRTLVLCVLLGALVGIAVVLLTPPTYRTTMTFFVATSAQGTNTPLQADEFAQRRINSYVGVINSERLATTVIQDTGLPLTPDQVSSMVLATVEADTVLLNVRVTDVSAERSLIVGRSIAKNLDALIGQLDNRGVDRNAVQLRVLSGPTLNPSPISPRRKLDLGIGLLLGLAVGVAQALVRHQLDRSIRTSDELARLTKLPTVGVLPLDPAAKNDPVLTPRAAKQRRAEAVRQLRTNLRFVDAASPVRVLVVTSSVESEGKSSTATNLAQSFAEAGRSVLLIDADLREPRVHRYLELERAAGLTSVLIGEAELSQVVQEWGPDGLNVLTSGQLPPNPSELLGSAAMERLVHQARSAYDLVILDTPPLLPVTDAAVTSVLADGVVLLVQHGRTHRDQVARSVEALRSVDARILGTVLSMVPVPRREKQSAYYGSNRSAALADWS